MYKRQIALCAAALLAAVAPSSATDTAASLRGKIFAAFAGVRSYRVTVLLSLIHISFGSVDKEKENQDKGTTNAP